MGAELFAALAAGYLLGGAPTAEILARLRGSSIFAIGSGNMGAMNTARHLGPLLGFVVLVVDVGKGAAASALGAWVGPLVGADAVGPALAAGVGAVAGHAWSPYVRFRGGKALATMLGVSLPLYPAGGLAGLTLILVLLLLLRRTTAATIATLVLYPAVVLLAHERYPLSAEVAAHDLAVVGSAIVVSGISIAKHVLALRSRQRPAVRSG